MGTDDTARPIPEDLAPAVNTAFGTRMPARVAIDTTVFRCAEGRVMVCTIGANIPCGTANTSREPGAGIVQWCRENPEAAFIPAVATGHDTVFEWRCRSGAAVIVRQAATVDRRGFVAEYWKVLP